VAGADQQAPVRLYALQTSQQRTAYQKRIAGCIGACVLKTLEVCNMDKKPASIIDKIKNTLLIFCNIAYAIELIAAYVLFNMRF
jgi:hypothetical protein